MEKSSAKGHSQGPAASPSHLKFLSVVNLGTYQSAEVPAVHVKSMNIILLIILSTH